jgi:hypothetical protein
VRESYFEIFNLVVDGVIAERVMASANANQCKENTGGMREIYRLRERERERKIFQQ